MTEFLIFGLATWRITSLFVNEDGPWFMFRKLRELAGISHDEFGRPSTFPERLLPGLLSCVWCCSIWVGLFWAVFYLLSPLPAITIATVFALSTVAIVIEQILVRH